MVVVVVPSLAQSHDGEQPVVTAGVGGLIPPRTEEVRQRIDGERVVPQEHSAQAKTPDKQMPSANQPKHGGQRNGGHHMIFVQPAQLRIFREVTDVIQAGVIVFVGNDPANMRPEKAKKRGGVKIIFLIGKTMMMTVMCGPPQDALLRGGHGHEGNDKLEDAAGLESAMREITVVARGDEKHANGKKRDAGNQIRPVKRYEKYQ